MNTVDPNQPLASTRQPGVRSAVESRKRDLLLLGVIWVVVFAASLFSPSLLDDADATHAQAAQAMLHTGDWVTLHVDGIRYLEKAPLPYWIAAGSMRLFGENAFAVHLPVALAVLGLALLGYVWARRSFGERSALYTGLFLLTSMGPFLFTRIFIPDALLSLLLAGGLYAFERTMTADHPRRFALAFWLIMALAVLTKGLIAIVFLLGAALLYMALTRSWREWRRLSPFTGLMLFFAVAAPWHVLAGLRNTGGAGGHGFFWFYFVNEHLLRFLGRHIPRDYNKLPAAAYWLLHLVWLFPWSFFAPVAGVLLWRKRQRLLAADTPAQRTFILLSGFSLLVLVFFSFSTNQEYYTFPAYLPLLMLLAAALAQGQMDDGGKHAVSIRRMAVLCLGALALIEIVFAAALVFGLVKSIGLPSNADIGTLLEHRGVGNYTLSLSHFFDLTGASFAVLRLPAALACAAFLVGPCAAWWLLRTHRSNAAVLTLATSTSVFLVAAHLALIRFAPVLSSRGFADTIHALQRDHQVAPDTSVLIFGDQAFGSSIPFYLGHPVQLVDGRSSSMLFGSTFPDVPPIFITSASLHDTWGKGSRKLLFVPAEQRDAAEHLLGKDRILVFESSGKELLTDRPLDAVQPAAAAPGNHAR